ncbi:MAG: TlpA disulfide reductase family protein [Phycisphaerae bacterium]|nr:TlpA disulfide reductase family protein [Phycisphaerae bacterium]
MQPHFPFARHFHGAFVAGLMAAVAWAGASAHASCRALQDDAQPPAAADDKPVAEPVETIPTEPDPAATAAVAALMKAYRERPALRVTESVAVSTGVDAQEGNAAPVSAEMTFAPGRKLIMRMRDFELRFSEGKVWATHESNPDTYIEAGDDDSPYYTLLAAFINLPFVSLALALGEEAVDETVMQLHPNAPNVIPASVRAETLADGSKRQHIVLLADGERLELVVDPATMLLVSTEARISRGEAVPARGSVTYRSAIVNEIPPKPFEEAAFRLDPGKRAKVDMFAQLRKKGAVDGGGNSGAGALVGRPAPEFSLPASDGGLVKSEDLAGRVVVLDFWATWCGPCRQALPELVKVAAWAAEQQLPVVVYPVNVFEQTQGHDRLTAVTGMFQQLRVTLPSLIDAQDKLASAYSVRAIPMTVVIRADGIVHSQHVGANDYLEMLKREIQDAIKAGEAGGKPPQDDDEKTVPVPQSDPEP